MSQIPTTEAIGQNSVPTLLELLRQKSQRERLAAQLESQERMQQASIESRADLQANELEAAAQQQQTGIEAERTARFDQFFMRQEEAAQGRDFARENREDQQAFSAEQSREGFEQAKALQAQGSESQMDLERLRNKFKAEQEARERKEREKEAAKALKLSRDKFQAIVESLRNRTKIADEVHKMELEQQALDVKKEKTARTIADLRKMEAEKRRKALETATTLFTKTQEARELWRERTQGALSEILADPENLARALPKPKLKITGTSFVPTPAGPALVKTVEAPSPQQRLETMATGVSNEIITRVDGFLQEVAPDERESIEDALRDVIRASFELTPGVKNTDADIQQASEALRVAVTRFLGVAGAGGQEILRTLADVGDQGVNTIYTNSKEFRGKTIEEAIHSGSGDKLKPYAGLLALRGVVTPDTGATREDMEQIIVESMKDADSIDKAILLKNLVDKAGWSEAEAAAVAAKLSPAIDDFLGTATKRRKAEESLSTTENEIARIESEIQHKLEVGDLNGLRNLLDRLQESLDNLLTHPEGPGEPEGDFDLDDTDAFVDAGRKEAES